MAKVLVVDDILIMRNMIKILLEGTNHEIVAEAKDGYEAYEAYKEYLPDVVTMDILMPNMDGIESLRKIKSEFPDAKIIMLSSLRERDKIYEAVNEGAKHFLIKPVEKEKLLKTIDEITETDSTPQVNQTEKTETVADETSSKDDEDVSEAEEKKKELQDSRKQESQSIVQKGKLILNEQLELIEPYNVYYDEDSDILLCLLGQEMNKDKNINALEERINEAIQEHPSYVFIDLRQLSVLSDNLQEVVLSLSKSIYKYRGKIVILSDLDNTLILQEKGIKARFERE